LPTWTTPRTWTAGEVVTAALLNTHLRDNLDAIDGPNGTFTPQFSTSGTWTTSTTTGFYSTPARTCTAAGRGVRSGGGLTTGVPLTCYWYGGSMPEFAGNLTGLVIGQGFMGGYGSFLLVANASSITGGATAYDATGNVWLPTFSGTVVVSFKVTYPCVM
jgi:hypothetical protein